MDFQDYISYTGLIVLYIDYAKDSTKTIDEVRDIAVSRCNRVAKASNVDVKCYVTDHHNGNKYIAYSDAMVRKYDVLKTNWQLDLDMKSINKMLNSNDNKKEHKEILGKLKELEDKMQNGDKGIDKSLSILENLIDKVYSAQLGGWSKDKDGIVTIVDKNNTPISKCKLIDKNGETNTLGAYGMLPIEDNNDTSSE